MQPSLNRLTHFFSISPLERRLLWAAFWLEELAWFCLLLLPLNKVAKILPRFLNQENFLKTREKRPEISQIGWAVSRAARILVPQKTCLVQSLAMCALFEKYGYKSQLKIGVAKNKNEKLEAHAWVESEGKVITDSAPGSEFKALPSFQTFNP